MFDFNCSGNEVASIRESVCISERLPEASKVNPDVRISNVDNLFTTARVPGVAIRFRLTRRVEGDFPKGQRG